MVKDTSLTVDGVLHSDAKGQIKGKKIQTFKVNILGQVLSYGNETAIFTFASIIFFLLTIAWRNV